MSMSTFVCLGEYRLLIPMYSEGTRCPRCHVPMDKWGDQAVQCWIGIGVAKTYRHVTVRDCLFRVPRELQLSVGREPQFPVQIPGLASRRPDLVFRDLHRGRDVFVHVVGTSPLAASYREAFTPAGAASQAAAG
jgi:hypothetical protein